MRRLISLLLAGVVQLPVQAAGVLKLSHSEITLGGPEPAGLLEAENVGDSPLYLEVTQQLIKTPVTQPEVRTHIGDVPAPTLLVSPQRLVLGPGQKQVLNLNELRQPRQQKIWRVTFRPREKFQVYAIGEVVTQVPLSVSVGYGVVIYQRGSGVE